MFNRADIANHLLLITVKFGASMCFFHGEVSYAIIVFAPIAVVSQDYKNRFGDFVQGCIGDISRHILI